MDKPKWIDKFIKCCKDKGWKMQIEDIDEYSVTFFGEWESPAWQIFRISLIAKDLNFDNLYDDIYEYYSEFDVCQETYYRLDETGHGQGDAPYNMKDLYEDVECYEKAILELHEYLLENYSDINIEDNESEVMI